MFLNRVGKKKKTETLRSSYGITRRRWNGKKSPEKVWSLAWKVSSFSVLAPLSSSSCRGTTTSIIPGTFPSPWYLPHHKITISLRKPSHTASQGTHPHPRRHWPRRTLSEFTISRFNPRSSFSSESKVRLLLILKLINFRPTDRSELLLRKLSGVN